MLCDAEWKGKQQERPCFIGRRAVGDCICCIISRQSTPSISCRPIALRVATRDASFDRL